ncbi:MAG: hypothetical protein FWF53_03660 [Candidatus Azobacteroides sp.]|nr:hypothetical protein [Candidatus Azobacteroides sp.]
MTKKRPFVQNGNRNMNMDTVLKRITYIEYTHQSCPESVSVGCAIASPTVNKVSSLRDFVPDKAEQYL